MDGRPPRQRWREVRRFSVSWGKGGDSGFVDKKLGNLQMNTTRQESERAISPRREPMETHQVCPSDRQSEEGN